MCAQLNCGTGILETWLTHLVFGLDGRRSAPWQRSQDATVKAIHLLAIIAPNRRISNRKMDWRWRPLQRNRRVSSWNAAQAVRPLRRAVNGGWDCGRWSLPPGQSPSTRWHIIGRIRVWWSPPLQRTISMRLIRRGGCRRRRFRTTRRIASGHHAVALEWGQLARSGFEITKSANRQSKSLQVNRARFPIGAITRGPDSLTVRPVGVGQVTPAFIGVVQVKQPAAHLQAFACRHRRRPRRMESRRPCCREACCPGLPLWEYLCWRG